MSRRFRVPAIVAVVCTALALAAWLVFGRADAAGFIALFGLYISLKLLGLSALQLSPERALLAFLRLRAPEPEEHTLLAPVLRDALLATGVDEDFDLRVLETPMANALVTGVAARRRILLFTTGMLDLLDEDELRAVAITLLVRTIPGPLRDEVREALAVKRTTEPSPDVVARRVRIELMADERAIAAGEAAVATVPALRKTLAVPGVLHMPAGEWGWLFYRNPGLPDDDAIAADAARLAAAERAAATLAGNTTNEP